MVSTFRRTTEWWHSGNYPRKQTWTAIKQRNGTLAGSWFAFLSARRAVRTKEGGGAVHRRNARRRNFASRALGVSKAAHGRRLLHARGSYRLTSPDGRSTNPSASLLANTNMLRSPDKRFHSLQRPCVCFHDVATSSRARSRRTCSIVCARVTW